MRPLDTPLKSMALDQLRQETTHEESANATHMLNQLNLINLELVHFVITTGNNRWFSSLLNLLLKIIRQANWLQHPSRILYKL